MFELLGEHELEWARIELFQVDERIAPDGDPDRNLTHLLASLPDAGARARCGRCRSTDADLEAAAERYAASCRTRSTSSTSASAPTATPPRWSRATRCSRSPTAGRDHRGEYQGRRRMTLTYPALDGGAPRSSGWSPGGEARRAGEAARRRPRRSRRAGSRPREATLVIARTRSAARRR